MRENILGVEIDKVNEAEALAMVREFIESGKQGYIVTPNPEIIMRARLEESFRQTLNRSFLSLADGVGVVVASKFLKKGISTRLTGVDFVYSLADLAAEHKYNLFFLGGFDQVAQKAAKKLQETRNGLKVTGTLSDVLPGRDDEYIVKRLTEKPINILFVAFGAPKQEEWLANNLSKTAVQVAIGVGGAFDVIAGKKARAPQVLQRFGLEWFYRLIQEPSRVRRQFALVKFAALVVRERFTQTQK